MYCVQPGAIIGYGDRKYWDLRELPLHACLKVLCFPADNVRAHIAHCNNKHPIISCQSFLRGNHGENSGSQILSYCGHHLPTAQQQCSAREKRQKFKFQLNRTTVESKIDRNMINVAQSSGDPKKTTTLTKTGHIDRILKIIPYHTRVCLIDVLCKFQICRRNRNYKISGAQPA